MSKSIEKPLTSFASISLSAIQDAALLKRVESKYLTSTELVSELLDKLGNEYSILEIDGRRIMNYETLYFDTPDKLFYKDHHRGKSYRIKIRKRQYVDSKTCFLEIKAKDKKKNTIKVRTPVDSITGNLSISSKKFINEHVLQDYDLRPSLRTRFKRITLVKNSGVERVTIDFAIQYDENESSKEFKNLAIIEIKQKRMDRNSILIKILKSMAIYPQSISKYVVGMVSLYPNIKYNNFKETLLQINKLSA